MYTNAPDAATLTIVSPIIAATVVLHLLSTHDIIEDYSRKWRGSIK
jgi:hypothetical protein